MDDDLDFLDEFIDNAFEEIEKNEKDSKSGENAAQEPRKEKTLKDFDFLAEKEEEEPAQSKKQPVNVESTCKKDLVKEKSSIHRGDTDDSEDEDNRLPSERKYNEFGQFVNSKLKEEERSKNESFSSLFKNKSWKSKERTNKDFSKSTSSMKAGDSFSSTIGLNIVNPLVSPGLLFEKMAGRLCINFIKLKYHVERLSRKDSEVLNKDWILIGVVVSKSAPRESKKGNNFCVWKISDLKMGLKTASLFLFGNSYTQLWKRPIGTAIGILNPSIMESRKDNVDEACISVYNADQVMVIGQSKDLGFCKARKNNGDSCTLFVNKSSCEFCIYHVQKEYKKFSNRSDLQSPTGGGLQNLRNKVLGKNEVFYAGQSYTAVKGTQSKKKVDKDQKTLKNLFGGSELDFQKQQILNGPQTSNSAPSIEFTRFKKIKDAELLAKLTEKQTRDKKTSEDTMKNSNRNSAGEKPLKNLKFSISTLPKKNKENNIVKKPTSTSCLNGRRESLDNLGNKIKSNNTEPKDDSVSKSRLESKLKVRDEAKNKKNDQSSEENIGCTEFSREALNEFFVKKNLSLDKLSNNRCQDKKMNLKQLKISEPTKCQKPSSTDLIIDVSMPVTRKDRERAKKTALNYIKSRGPIKKVDPNEVRNKNAPTKKRSFPEDEEEDSTSKGAENSLPSRFIELMNKTSTHMDLVEKADEDSFNNYFEKMNKKEEMEEKMLSTYKLPCKAVRCLNCKYTWFSASDLCKSEGHRIKVVDAMKRFFRCSNCSNRTVSLEIIPLISCRNCGNSNWLRAAMMSEKRTLVNLNQLSIRGGEQKFIHSVECNGNLNLLVPD